jgi:hypothetical protein
MLAARLESSVVDPSMTLTAEETIAQKAISA